MRLRPLLFFAGVACVAACSRPPAPPAASAASPPAFGDLRFWLQNMAWDHRYAPEEMAAATGLAPEDVARRLREFGIDEAHRPPRPAGLYILPYPGGRHPRIGFQNGAVNPQRGTKCSVFLPGTDGAYVVVDLPEAVWANGQLYYLCHEDANALSIWDRRGVKLPPIDWTRRADGGLESRRAVPNGVAYEARVAPRGDAVDMELRIRNGSTEALTKVKGQVCVLLKGAPGFNAQTPENKRLFDNAAAVRSDDGRRWIVTAWERGKPWQNPPCPCIHSDPDFPDLAPGGEAAARGTLFLYEGGDPEAEVERRKQAGTLYAN